MLNQSFFEIGATLFGYEQFLMNISLKREMMKRQIKKRIQAGDWVAPGVP